MRNIPWPALSAPSCSLVDGGAYPFFMARERGLNLHTSSCMRIRAHMGFGFKCIGNVVHILTRGCIIIIDGTHTTSVTQVC